VKLFLVPIQAMLRIMLKRHPVLFFKSLVTFNPIDDQSHVKFHKRVT